MKKRINNIKVIKNEENPETPQILAESLIKISDAFESLMAQKGGLNEDAIITLISAMAGMRDVKKGDIKLVLSSLKRLKSYYIQK